MWSGRTRIASLSIGTATGTKVKGTPAWAEYTLTVKATGKDVLKFQRVSSNGSPCLDAISVELATP